MPLGQFVYNSTRSKGYQYGVMVDHISAFAQIKTEMVLHTHLRIMIKRMLPFMEK